MRKLLLLAMTLVICGSAWAQNEFVYVKLANKDFLYGRLTSLSLTNGNGDTIVLSGKDITLVVKGLNELQSWDQSNAQSAKKLFTKQLKNLQQQLTTNTASNKNASSLINSPVQSRVYIEQADGKFLYAVLNEMILMDENNDPKKLTTYDFIKIVKKKEDTFVSERRNFQNALRVFGEPEETQIQLAQNRRSTISVHTSVIEDSTLNSNSPTSTGEIVMLRAQTTIPMKAAQEVRARKVLAGDRIPFTVSTDIYQGDKLVIPAGTKAYARVTNSRKSAVLGIQGRLDFVMDYLILPNGQRIYLESKEIVIKGKNRTRASVGAAIITFGFSYLILGKKAVLPQGYEVVAHTLSEQEILM